MKISEVAGNDLIDDWMRQQHVWIESVLSRLNARYPLARCGVSYTDNPGMDALAYAGAHTFIINTAHWKPDVLEKYQRDWNGLVVDSSPEGTIEHEFGHVLVKAIIEVKGLHETWDIIYKHAGIPNELEPIRVQPVSVYAQENASEFSAECFVAQLRNKTAPHCEAGLQIAKALWAELLSAGATRS